MKAEIIKKTKDGVIIKWSSNIGFGEIAIKYGGQGRFLIDAEYIGIDTLFEIIKTAWASEFTKSCNPNYKGRDGLNNK